MSENDKIKVDVKMKSNLSYTEPYTLYTLNRMRASKE